MSALKMTNWAIGALALSLALQVASTVAGPIGVVDDFNTPGIGEYTLTRVLDNGIATSNIAFSDASGALVPTYSGTPNQAEQVVLLRSDAPLGIGEILMGDVAQPTSTVEMDFGIAISATGTPGGVGNPTPTDVRGGFDWLSVSIRPNQNAIRVNHVNGGVVTTGSHVIGSVDETSVRNLFIERLTATTFNVGYTDTSFVKHIANLAPLSFTASNLGTAIGFYSDMRSAGTGSTSLGAIDNLRIVPEPASWLMGILGLIGAAPLWKRRVRT
jgi:hypothetical protein